jgi:uncharacterized metal-binding protein YceD (DUF177 family)
MSEVTPESPLRNASIRLDQLPANGRNLVLKAEPDECAAIAERLKLDSVQAFSARVHAAPIKGGIQIKGQLEADLSQLCVVTFVPVAEHIEEEFSRIFLAGGENTATHAAGAEVFVDLEGEDLPDYFEGPDVDLTDLLMEILALAITPYPRAPDAELPEIASDDDEGEASPFAALEQLKRGRD